MTHPKRPALLFRRSLLALVIAGVVLASQPAHADLTPAQLDQLTDPAGWERSTTVGRETLYFQTYQNRYVHTISRVHNGREEHQTTLGNFSFQNGKLVLRSYVRNCPSHFEGTFVLGLRSDRLDLARGGSFARATDHLTGPSDNVPGCFIAGKFRARDEFAQGPPAPPSVAGTDDPSIPSQRSNWRWKVGDIHGNYGGFQKTPVFLWPDGRFVLGVPIIDANLAPDFEATRATLHENPRNFGTYRIKQVAGHPNERDIVFQHGDGERNEDRLTRASDQLWTFKKLGVYQYAPSNVRELHGTFARSVSMSAGAGSLSAGQIGVDLHVSNFTTLTFGPGRRFSKNSNTTVMAPTRVGDGTGASRQVEFDGDSDRDPEEHGTYAISREFITFRYASGRVERHLFRYGSPVLSRDTGKPITDHYIVLGAFRYSCGNCSAR